MKDRYDVVIAGAGPAGATAGLVLARSGLSVALIDRERFPRLKPCAGAISGRGAEIIAELHGNDALPRLARASSLGCRMFDRTSLLGEANGSVALTFVDRREFDLFLLDAARAAGCAVFHDRKVVEADAACSQVILGTGETVRGSVIVGADGVTSIVGKTALGHRANIRRRKTGFGLVADVPLRNLKTDALRADCSRAPHIFFGVLPYGYGWIFPRGDVLSVGVGGALKKGTEFRKALHWLVRQYFNESTWATLRPRGHLFPFGAPPRSPGRGNILLVGDAAGLVEPVTGEGIAFAVESGRLAAATILQSIADRQPSASGEIYNRLVRRRMLGPLRQAAVAQCFLFSNVCRPTAMRSLRRHPKLIANYLEVVAGKMSYPGYIVRLIVEVLVK